MSCVEGYTGESVGYACEGGAPGQEGEFSGGSVECQANLCDESSLPTDANVSNCSGARFMEECSLTCLPGYNNTGTNPATFSCTISGDFNGTIGCLPNGIPCDAGTLPDGTGVNASDCANKTTGESCNVSCAPGYTGDYADMSATFLCEGSAAGAGDFSGSITCTADPCDASTLPSVEGADITSCSSIMYAETCSVSCEQGYSGDSVTWSCDASGSFGAESVSCIANACDALSSEDGVDASSCSGKTTGQSCEVSCFQGYTGDAVAKTCDADGTFSGNSVSCIANACETGLPTDESVDTSACYGATTTQTCAVTCAQGYTGSPVTFACIASGELSPSTGPSAGPSDECSANTCETSTLPTGTGINTTDCMGKRTLEECTIQCEQGYTAVGSTTATCSASGEFDHSTNCEPNACDISTLPPNVATDSCHGTTTGMQCTQGCRAGFTQDSSAIFSCLGSGSFEGDLVCSPVQLQLGLSGDAGNDTITRVLAFAVSQNADQLVEELSDPSSAASQAVASSFVDAMGLPETAQVSVLSAALQRRLMHQRRLQESLSAVLEVVGVTAQDAETLSAAMETDDASNALGAHLAENLRQVEGLDIGTVESVSIQPLPADDEDAPNNAGNNTESEGFQEPEDSFAVQWGHLLTATLLLRVLL